MISTLLDVAGLLGALALAFALWDLEMTLLGWAALIIALYFAWRMAAGIWERL